ncbi:DNA repair protein RecN [Dokdonia sinensis]|uniref:DNA repair protein RecN n=1 Tax=Dokdonia sinensis TaxID=2479847 RepID=A0A3M0FTX4_9FLAO|nr:DNA repair protein RecN [Dokdonia sinensis]RMB56134.1 DNA repair protein RecN [Dokdonia sinensis]
MLQTLSIKNYALIEEVAIQLNSGFTVITGETGAGKSILLGALGLITGKRADSSSAGDPLKKCIIEGTFQISGYKLESFFEREDLDFEPLTIVRREIAPSGKSRAFINDTPVTLQQLSQLGERLVDIHSQHKTMDVVVKEYQFDVLDTFAGNVELLKGYKSHYREWKSKEDILKSLLSRKQNAQLEFDYQQFLFTELDEASIKPGEFEELEEVLKTLTHADEIVSQLSNARLHLAEEESGALDRVAAARSSLNVVSKFSGIYQQLFERLQSVQIELDDISQEVDRAADDVNVDPLELERTNLRVQQLYNLMQKHKVSETSDLIALRDRLDADLQASLNVDGEIESAKASIAFAKAELEKIAGQLHIQRVKAIKQLEAEILRLLKSLGMENAQFQIQLRQTDEFFGNGMDEVAFLFSANAGMEVKPLGKGASGGELSRVMLAIKSVLGKHKKLPTLIFDEIDTGVSGEVALKMGGILKNMGSSMQLLSITHLPQIAGQGEAHLKVFKTDEQGRTKTKIVALSEEDRVTEIAEMLGGGNHTASAIEHAKNLLH